MRYYDNTRVSTARSCLRKFYFRHVRDWVPDHVALPLAFGLSWHDAMDVVWGMAKSHSSNRDIYEAAMAAFQARWVEEGLLDWDEITPEKEEQMSPRTPGVAAEMIQEYIKVRRPWIATIELVSIEQPFAVPLYKDNPDLFYIGRFDKVFKEAGKIRGGEHKTSTSYKKGGPFRTDYMESWSPNSQIDGYLHAGHMLYGDDFAEMRIDAALVHKQVHNGFKFIPIKRQLAQLDAWLYETRFWINVIDKEREVYNSLLRATSLESMPYLAAFPKNTNACNEYAGCPYREICKMVPNPDQLHEPPQGYKVEHWEPFEILDIEKLGLPPEDK